MVGNLLIAEGNLSSELVALIDERLSKLSCEAGETDCAELLGYYDSIEHLTGLGFVTCQTFMTAVYGILRVSKKEAIPLGPFHDCGSSYAAIVNAAANYWKHSNEWVLDRSQKQRELVEEAFESIGFPVGVEYPLSGILTELSLPHLASFAPIFSRLRAWEGEVRTLRQKKERANPAMEPTR